MAYRSKPKTTFEPEKTIQPIYTGGGVALDETGTILATCIEEDVSITSLDTGAQLGRIEGDGEAVTSLAITPSASHLVVCSRSCSMYIYSLDSSPSIHVTHTLRKTLKPHPSPVITSAVDQTGTLAATGGADGVVKIWDISGGYLTHTFRGHSGLVSALCFFEVQTAPAPLENGLSTEKRSKASRKDAIAVENTHSKTEDTVRAFRLATASEDGQIRIWDLQRRKCLSVLDSHISVVRGLDFCSATNMLVSGSRDKTVTLWDADNWKIVRVLPILEGVESLTFMKNGNAICTGGESGRVRLWETENGREITQQQSAGGESENIVAMIYYRELPFVLTVHGDHSLLLHSLESLRDLGRGDSLPPLPVVRRISGTHDEIIDLALLTHSRSFLALATNSEDMRIISISSEKSSKTISTDETPRPSYFGADVALLKGHDDIIICLDVDWSGHWLATGAKDNTARLWRIDPSTSSFDCYATFTGHAESLGAVALPRSTPAPGSAEYTDPLNHPPSFLLTGSQDRTVKRWVIPSMSSTATLSTRSARAMYTRKAHEKDINALDISHNTALFASASQDRLIKVWSSEEGEVQGVLRGHRRGVWSVRFSPKDAPSISGDNGKASSTRGYILSGSGDKTVKIWSVADYSCLLTFEGHTNSILKVLWLPSSNRKDDDQPDKGSSGPTQVASAGGDGLVKIWDIASGDLACTLDNHTDRVWALASNPSSGTLISGGADAVITFWTDTTAVTAAASTAAATQRVEQDQQLMNHMRAGAYREAITLALQLNHPARLLALFTNVAFPSDPNEEENGSLTGKLAVDEVLGSLAEEQLHTLLCRVRDWNTNARTAMVAQRVLGALVRLYPAEKFVDMRRRGGKGGMKGIVDALAAYSERHYKRLEELVDESYLVEYTLREMDEVQETELPISSIGARKDRAEDMVMV